MLILGRPEVVVGLAGSGFFVGTDFRTTFFRLSNSSVNATDLDSRPVIERNLQLVVVVVLDYVKNVVNVNVVVILT